MCRKGGVCLGSRWGKGCGVTKGCKSFPTKVHALTHVARSRKERTGRADLQASPVQLQAMLPTVAGNYSPATPADGRLLCVVMRCAMLTVS